MPNTRDKEKLIELLKNNREHYLATYIIKHRKSYEEYTADHLIANGVTVQEWISVKDRLPEVGSRVLACGEKGGVFLVKAEGKTTGFGKMDGASKVRSFTHWIPLPQPPKGE